MTQEPPPKMGGFRRPGRGGEVFTPWWLSGLSGGGRGGCNPPPPPLGFLVSEIKPASSWTTWIREGGGGGRDPRARAAAQIGHFRPTGRQNPDSPPRKPALRGPRRRGVWGGSLLLPPPLFPGLLGPLEAAVGGLPGEGRTLRSSPRLGTPRPHTSPPPGGPSPRAPSCGVYAKSLEIRRNSMQATPHSRPFRGLSLREGKLSRRWGTCTFSGGGVREVPSP